MTEGSGSSSGPASRAALGKEVGLLAHELHNILTVLFGVAEELQRDPAPIAAQNAPLLQAGVDKTEEVARRLFALRQQSSTASTADGAGVAEGLAAWSDAAGPLARALEEAPTLQAEPACVERLLLATCLAAGRMGGLLSAGPSPGPADPRSSGFAISLTFADEDRLDEAVAWLTPMAGAAGGAVRRNEACGLVLELPAARDA